MDDSDDFGLDGDDLGGDIELDDSPPPPPRGRAPGPQRSAAGESLFSSAGGDDDGFGLGDADIDHGPPAAAPRPPPPRPSAPAPSRGRPGRPSGDSDLFGDDDEDDAMGLGGARAGGRGGAGRGGHDSGGLGLGSAGDLTGDLDIDHGDGGLPPPPPRGMPPRPSAPPPQRRQSGGRGGGDSLFGDDDDDDGLGLGGGGSSGLGLGLGGTGDIEIDHDEGGRPGRRPPAPAPVPRAPPPPSRPAGQYTDPEISLMGDDPELAELLGGAGGSSAGGRPPPAPPPATMRAPPPPPPRGEPSGGGFGLDAEDDELAELLGEARPPAPPPQPQARQTGRRISFKEPVSGPPSRRGGSRTGSLPPQDDDFGDRDSFGTLDDPDQEVARIAAGNSRGRGGIAHRFPAPQDSMGDDFGSTSGSRMGDSSFGSRPPAPGARPPLPHPAGGPSFRRVAAQESDAYDSFDSPAHSQRQLPPRGGPPRGSVRDSEAYGSETYGSEAYGYDDGYGDGYGDGDGDMYDSRSPPGGPAAFRRVPAGMQGTPQQQQRRPAAPGPYDEDDYYDDEDDDDYFADDLSWDGEVRGTRGAYRGRPGSAGHPRSRGPHSTGGRRRPLSAMAPRERQAAMMEDMMSRHPSTWDIREVATWVEFIGMGQYRIKFVHHSVDGTLLLSLGEAELARDLRILPLGHRRALLGAVAELKEHALAMEQGRAEAGLPPSPGADGKPQSEAARVAELRKRVEGRDTDRRPASAAGNVIPPEPYLGPAVGKITVYEQRAKLLYQLDKARHRAAQHAAIIDQLKYNKDLTEAQVAELRGKLKDLEHKHKDVLAAKHPGMAAPVGGGTGTGTAALAAAELGPDVAIPWQPVGRGTRVANRNPERYARPGDDPTLDHTFIPRVTKLHEVPVGSMNPRDIVAKALASRMPFWRRMDFEFEKMKKERDARDEARRKRRERMGMVKRGGAEGEDDEQTKSKHWNNYWVPGSKKNASYHKHFRQGGENEELRQYRGFTRDKTRLSRWFRRFVDDHEETEGDLVLEQLINRMIKALTKTQAQMDEAYGEEGLEFDKKIRQYFKERGYKTETVVSKTIMVRAHGTRAPGPSRPDNTMYDFEEIEQYYPDYLRKKVQGADDDGGGGGDDARMVPQKTMWKRLKAMYYMDRQKKIRSAIAMVKMSQFVQRHGARWPPERDRDEGKKVVWVPNSRAGALHQIDGRDRTFNNFGQEQIGLQVKLKKTLGPQQPVTFQMKMKEQEAYEAKADRFFGEMGWPHSSGDDALGPPQEPLLMPGEGGEGDGFGLGGPEDGEGGDGFGLGGLDGEGGGGDFGFGGEGGDALPHGRRPARRRAAAPPRQRLDFWQALDSLLNRGLDLRKMHDDWAEMWRLSRARGYGMEELSEEPPRADEMDWSRHPLLELQQRAMARQREEWLVAWEKARRVRERRAARMWQQGYHEQDIERTLGPQQDAGEVEDAVRNHLHHNVTLLARLKPQDILRMRDDMKGTKKKMAVYRALCNQLYLDEVAAKEAAREQKLRDIYADLSLPRNPRTLTGQQMDNFVSRVAEQDVRRRDGKIRELKTRKAEELQASLTPWYVLHPPSRPVSPGPSRTGSPDRRRSRSPDRRRSRSPGPPGSVASNPRPRSASRGRSSGGGGPGPGAGGVAFGSGTPRNVGFPFRLAAARSTRTPEGSSLLDSAILPGGSTAEPRSVSRSERPARPSTPTRSARPATPTRSNPQRPHSAAGLAPPSPRNPAGARPRTAVPGGPPARPASPGPARMRPGGPAPPASPRPGQAKPPGTARVGFASPAPSRPGAAKPAAPSRRGLMDGDTTSGASASPSPERAPRQSASGRGLVDTDSSPSPPPARRQPPAQPQPPSTALSSTTGGGSSRRSSQAGGVASQRQSTSGAASQWPSASGGPSATSQRASASGGPSQRPSTSGGPSQRPSTSGGPSQRPSMSGGPSSHRPSASGSATGGPASGLASPRASGARPATPPSKQTSSSSGIGPAGPGGRPGSRAASGSGSGAGSVAGSQPGSRRPSTPPSPMQGQPQPNASAPGSRRPSQSAGMGAGGGGQGPAGPAPERSGGSTHLPQARSPLSRSSNSMSPPAGSTPPRSPTAPSPQASARSIGAAGAGQGPGAGARGGQMSAQASSGGGTELGPEAADEYEYDLEDDDVGGLVDMGAGDDLGGDVDLGGEDEF